MKKIKIRLINRTDQLTDMDGEIKKPALERVQPLDHRDSLRLTTSFTRKEEADRNSIPCDIEVEERKG